MQESPSLQMALKHSAELHFNKINTEYILKLVNVYKLNWSLEY